MRMNKKLKRRFLIQIFNFYFFLTILFLPGISQAFTNIDSLENSLSKSKNKEEKKQNIIKLIQYLSDVDSAKCFKYITYLYDEAKTNNDIETQAQANLLEGHYFKKRGNFNRSIESIHKALQLIENTQYKDLLAKIYNDLGSIYTDKGDYNSAAHWLMKSIKLHDQLNNPLMLSKSLLNLGLIFYYQKNYDLALRYYQDALKIRENLKDSTGIAFILNNMGIVYYLKQNTAQAIKYFTKALEIHKKKNSLRHMSLPLFNIGEIYFEQAKYDPALHYYQQSYRIDTLLHDEASEIKSLLKIAQTYAMLQQYERAMKLSQRALDMAIKIDSKEDIKDAYLTLSELYRDKNNYKKAFEYLELSGKIKDTLYNISLVEKVAELQLKYESEKKDLKLQQQHATIQHQKTINRILFISITAIIIFLVFGIIEYVQKRKAFKILAIQKKNITDSIRYASKIQSALLPPDDFMKKLLPESFIFYLPKEVVSGDFYWVSSLNDRIYIALADCTGHGVPGAFMSMLGFAYLNEIVSRNPNIKSSEILDLLRIKVKESLHQHEGSESKDGMDIALAIYIPTEKKIEYSGANIPLMICRDKKIFYLPPDKMPIGFYFQEINPFSSTIVYLQPNDIVYLSSDGYSDQFGGNSMKKLGKVRFEQILIEASTLPIKAQRYFLEEKFLEWQNEIEQIDDISILGIKIC